MYAQVIVDIAHADVDRLFTYAVPQGMALACGQHVRVPFGKGNKPKEAFVIALCDLPPAGIANIKTIAELIEPYPIFFEQQLELARWMQQSYHCLLVDALRQMIPAQMRGGRVHEKRLHTLRVAPGLSIGEARVALLKKNGAPKAPKQLLVFDFMVQTDAEIKRRDIAQYVPDSANAVQALLQKGYLEESDTVTFRRPAAGESIAEETRHALTPAQRRALQTVVAGIEEGAGAFLLHGVTGSGKTEVYMRAISHCLGMGKEAILLVPEIALTPQTMGLFRARFGDLVAVMHSRLSAGERFDEWRRIRLKMARVAVGARSAIFAPFENLGLVVIDEEHEQSYQSETVPRYDAVEVAIRRCALAGAPLVLGSATPRIQSYLRARAGRYALLELPERIGAYGMPAVDIIDMRQEFIAGNNGIFSGMLRQRLADCLGSGKQAILFINRRGYSTFVSCRGCGHVFQCPNCDISATYHKTEERVKCHFCGYGAPVPSVCPACQKPYLKYFGVGTQQVEEQLYAQFPGVRALRMDKDSTRSKDAHEDMLGAFRRGEAQVL
ncbi:MAG: primosomal protein N', partial [Clostridiales bacterium]|nr:primosomal protein N' [Clostridiales bacterium]